MASKEKKRVTVCLDGDLHRAVKIKADLSSITISELISEAIRDSLREDAADISTLESVKNEPTTSLENVLKEFNLERLVG